MIAKVYFEEGNKEYRKKETYNAIYFYTEGIKVNCKDVQLNAKLYSNRATAYFYLGKVLFFVFSVFKFVDPHPLLFDPKDKKFAALPGSSFWRLC